MASKTNMTSDGEHVQFGNEDHMTTAGLPFSPGNDSSGFCPNYFGRVMQNPNNAGFGSAYAEIEEYDD